MNGKYENLLIQIMLLVAFAISLISSSVVVGTVRDNMNSTYAAPYAYTSSGVATITTFSSFIKPIGYLIFFVWIVVFFKAMADAGRFK